MVRRKLAKKYDRPHEVWFHIDLNDPTMDVAGWVKKLRATRSSLDAVQVFLPTSKTNDDDDDDELLLLPLWAALSSKHLNHLHIQGPPAEKYYPYLSPLAELRLPCLSLALAELSKTLSTLSLSAIDLVSSSPEHTLAETMDFAKALNEQGGINRIILNGCRIATDLMRAAIDAFGDGSLPNLEAFDSSSFQPLHPSSLSKRKRPGSSSSSSSSSSLQAVAFNTQYSDRINDVIQEAILEFDKSSPSPTEENIGSTTPQHHQGELRLQILALRCTPWDPGFKKLLSNVPFAKRITVHTLYGAVSVYSSALFSLLGEFPSLESMTFRVVHAPQPRYRFKLARSSRRGMGRMLWGDPAAANLMTHHALKDIRLIDTGGKDIADLPPMIQFYLLWNRLGRTLENASAKEQEDLLRQAQKADNLDIWFSLLAESPMLLP